MPIRGSVSTAAGSMAVRVVSGARTTAPPRSRRTREFCSVTLIASSSGMSQYCGVPSVWMVQGRGAAIDSSELDCVQLDSLGYSICEATASYVPDGALDLKGVASFNAHPPGDSIE